MSEAIDAAVKLPNKRYVVFLGNICNVEGTVVGYRILCCWNNEVRDLTPAMFFILYNKFRTYIEVPSSAENELIMLSIANSFQYELSLQKYSQNDYSVSGTVNNFSNERRVNQRSTLVIGYDTKGDYTISSTGVITHRYPALYVINVEHEERKNDVRLTVYNYTTQSIEELSYAQFEAFCKNTSGCVVVNANTNFKFGGQSPTDYAKYLCPRSYTLDKYAIELPDKFEDRAFSDYDSVLTKDCVIMMSRRTSSNHEDSNMAGITYFVEGSHTVFTILGERTMFSWLDASHLQSFAIGAVKSEPTHYYSVTTTVRELKEAALPVYGDGHHFNGCGQIISAVYYIQGVPVFFRILQQEQYHGALYWDESEPYNLYRLPDTLQSRYEEIMRTIHDRKGFAEYSLTIKSVN